MYNLHIFYGQTAGQQHGRNPTQLNFCTTYLLIAIYVLIGAAGEGRAGGPHPMPQVPLLLPMGETCSVVSEKVDLTALLFFFKFDRHKATLC